MKSYQQLTRKGKLCRLKAALRAVAAYADAAQRVLDTTHGVALHELALGVGGGFRLRNNAAEACERCDIAIARLINEITALQAAEELFNEGEKTQTRNKS